MIIEHLISYLYQVKGYLEGGERTLVTYPINEIIKSLEEGKENEKYKAMWKDFYVNEGDLVKVVNYIKNRYEQKYFPKKD